MRFSKADAAFTGAILAGVALLSFALYLHNRPRSTGSGEAIGKVFYKREIAMRKFSDRLVWEDVENGTPLYAYDAVMTGNYSDAELVLNNGLRLKLEANTLIELDLGSGELNLKLAGGGIKATGSPEARTKITTVDGQAISVNDASASIRTTGSQTAVEVSSGQVAVVNKEGSTQTVATNEILAAGQKSRLTLQLSGIAEDAVIMAAGNSATVTVNCAGGAGTVEFAQRPDMQAARTVALNDGKATARLNSGDWYSRCRGKDNAISAIRHFRILRAGAYRVLQPDSVVTYTEKPEVRFAFTPPRGVSRTKIEIASNARFENAVFSQELSQPSAIVALPRAGTWHYRLTPLGDGVTNVTQLTPVTGSFQLLQDVQKKQLTFVAVAEPIFPIAQIQAGKGWIYYEGSGRYRYEIIARGRNEVIARGEADSGSVKLPHDLKGGRYELRLSGGNERASQNFTVRERIAIDLTTPQEGAVIHATPGTQTAVLPVAWRVSEEVPLFEVILAADAELKRVLRRLNVEQREFRFTGLKPGRYYIKVLALEDNVPRAETRTLSVQIEDRLPPVSGVFPKQYAKVDVTRTDGIALRWQAVAGANSYEVRLLQKRQGVLVPVQTLVTTKPNAVFSDIRKLNEGELVWEVSALHVDKSGKVLQQSEPVRSSVNISFGEAPPPPEIVPIVEE